MQSNLQSIIKLLKRHRDIFFENNNTEYKFEYDDIIRNKFQVEQLSIYYVLKLKEDTINEFEKLSVPLKTNFLEELEIFLLPLLNEIYSAYFANDFEKIHDYTALRFSIAMIIFKF